MQQIFHTPHHIIFLKKKLKKKNKRLKNYGCPTTPILPKENDQMRVVDAIHIAI
jgi:hypothetical protein